MANEIVPRVFSNDEFGELRVIRRAGEPWFVAKDVCRALGLTRQQDSTRYLDADEKGECLVDTPGGKQSMVIVSEPGLYALVLKSRRPEAKSFRRWVTHDVIPSLRRDGAYVMSNGEEDEDVLIGRALLAVKRRLNEQIELNEILSEERERLLPKAAAYDSAIEADGTMTVTEATRYLAQINPNIRRKWLYEKLREDGIVCKLSYEPTRYALDHGYAVQMLTTRPNGESNPPYLRLTRKGLDWCIQRYCGSGR